ncbi:MAG: signal peptidase II [Clostridiales Family XIII bacterium]|jgi:signal peptidase II|nr:signal peptidase II [Clostridiales Family XIII bacterium]
MYYLVFPLSVIALVAVFAFAARRGAERGAGTGGWLAGLLRPAEGVGGPRALACYLAIPAVVAADQATKLLVSAWLAPGGRSPGDIPVIPGFFDITYVRNTGAAFNILRDRPGLLSSFVMLLLAAMLAYIFLRGRKESAMVLAGVSLVAGGGIGNLVDRLRLGYVVDFLGFGSFPVFNAADIAVCTGCGLIILHFALSERRAARAGKGAADGPAG